MIFKETHNECVDGLRTEKEREREREIQTGKDKIYETTNVLGCKSSERLTRVKRDSSLRL